MAENAEVAKNVCTHSYVKIPHIKSVDFIMIQQRSLQNSGAFITYKIPKQFHTQVEICFIAYYEWIGQPCVV